MPDTGRLLGRRRNQCLLLACRERRCAPPQSSFANLSGAGDKPLSVGNPIPYPSNKGGWLLRDGRADVPKHCRPVISLLWLLAQASALQDIVNSVRWVPHSRTEVSIDSVDLSIEVFPSHFVIPPALGVTLPLMPPPSRNQRSPPGFATLPQTENPHQPRTVPPKAVSRPTCPLLLDLL
jgi:hypothetical protein